MPSPVQWLKNRLERLLLSSLMVQSRVLVRARPASRHLQIIIPHRFNWRLTSATVRAFSRLTTGEFGITVVVNFDEIPPDWDGWNLDNLTLVHNTFSPFGRLFRLIFRSENGSMSNALALSRGLEAEPGYEWAFMAHSDSAPLVRGWNELYFSALHGGLVLGNLRDRSRVFAAHASGTLFHQREFLKRGGSVWPRYRFGVMAWDVGDGVSMTLHDSGGPVPVLPNNLQNPELSDRVHPSMTVLKMFVGNGTNLTFAEDGLTPLFAHMGRGTPRSQEDSSFRHKLPVDQWIDWIETLR